MVTLCHLILAFFLVAQANGQEVKSQGAHILFQSTSQNPEDSMPQVHFVPPRDEIAAAREQYVSPQVGFPLWPGC